MVSTVPGMTNPIRIKSVNLRNFRKSTEVDLHLERHIQTLCLVGPNGAGKSSLLSLMGAAIRKYTRETGPDAGEESSAPRHYGGQEINYGKEVMVVKMTLDWSGDGGANDLAGSHASFWYTASNKKKLVEHDALIQELGGIKMRDNLFSERSLYFKWDPLSPSSDDPVAHSVVLVRPSDRFERADYEEPVDLAANFTRQSRWLRRRPLPMHVRSGLHEVENFLLDMFLDASGGADNPSVRSAAKYALEMLDNLLRRLTNSERNLDFTSWPYRRVLFGNHHLSALSAGELDVFVTAACIIMQQVYLYWKDYEPGDEMHIAGGVVLIDGIDAHLHPQWQERVVPLLMDLFPTIQFVITTHSPFVIRSLPPKTTRIVRLPDGECFEEDFSAWDADSITEALFNISGTWSSAILEEIREFERAVKNDDFMEARRLYLDLASRSAPLRARIDRTLASLASTALYEEIQALSPDKEELTQ